MRATGARAVSKRAHALVRAKVGTAWCDITMLLDLVAALDRQTVLLTRYRRWVRAHAPVPTTTQRELERP